MGGEPDLRARMRQGVSGALRRVSGARPVSGISLVALICAAAFAPLLAAGVAAGPVVVAGVGVAGAVGANILTDVVKGAMERLRGDGTAISPASVEEELAKRLEEALVEQGESASALREALAAVLRSVDAVRAVVEAAAEHDKSLLPVMLERFTGLGGQFSEFAFVLDEVRRTVWKIEEAVRQSQAASRVDQERNRELGLILVRGLEAMERHRASAVAPESPAFTWDPVWSGCPYLGLVPFEERDARVFYGRRELVVQLVQLLLERLDGTGILLVAGESGSGKSSLLRAGLMPRLAAGALGPGSERWPRRVIRPTDSPLQELAMHLADVAGTDPVSVRRSLSAAPQEAPMLVEQAVRKATGHDPNTGSDASVDAAACPPPRLVLVVDQFEELFTPGDDTDSGQVEREAFIAALHATATVPISPYNLPRALVVAVVRADFLGPVLSYPPLKAAVDAGPFTVGPMSEAELRLALTGPAAEARLDLEPALVNAVISDLREGAEGRLSSGVLPLMSQAMAATWEGREGNTLTLRAYRRAGGVADAVNRSAQAAYDALTSRQKDAARLVFTQLTVITPDGQFARRRCSRADLHSREAEMAADIDAVIDIFSARRLLVLGEDSVEISHDALLHAWKQLRDWLGDDQLDRALYSQVVTDASTWDRNRRDPSYLYRPGRLATIDAATARWQEAPTRYPPLTDTTKAFLHAAHHAAHRGTRRRRSVIAGLLALTVIAMSAAGIAVRDAANASRQHAIALSRQLAAEGLAIESRDPLTARRLAVAAWHVFPTDQARSLMTTLLTEQQQDGTLFIEPFTFPGVNGVAFSPDGKLLATADSDGTVRLVNPATEQTVGALPADTRGLVDGVAFSPDGKLLATADSDGTVRLFNPATGQPVGAPIPADTGPDSSVNGVAFSPDGKLLATADNDGTVRLWNPATERPVGAPLPIRGGVAGVAFSPDGTLLATADDDGTVRLFNPATGQAVSALPADTGGRTSGVAFSADGRLLAAADVDGTVRLFNSATGQPVGAPIPADTGKFGGVLGVAFSPDGTLLATADEDGTVRLFNPATGRAVGAPIPANTATESGVNGVAFSPDGTLLATADGDGTVRLVNPSTRRAPLAPVPTRPDGALGVAFSPDGKLLATADTDGTVQLFNPAIGQPVGAPIPADTGKTGGVFGVAFSPDGKLLATADGDGTVRLFNPATGRAVGAPIPADTGGGLGVLGVAFSPDGKLLATADGDGTVRLFNPATGRPVGAPLPADTSSVVGAVAFSPDGKLLATADGDGTVRLFNPATGRPVGAPITADTRGVYGPALSGVAFSPDGTLLATADGDNTVRLFNPATGQPVGTPLPAGHGGGASSVAFSPDGKLLATADTDGTVQLFNPATGQAVGVPLPAGRGGGVDGVAFSPHGELLATANGGSTAEIWQASLFADPYAALCADVGSLTKADWTQYAPGEPQPRVCG